MILPFAHNKSLKPTPKRVTLFVEKAKHAPYYGGLVPPFYPLPELRMGVFCKGSA